MDYKTKPTSRKDLRQFAKWFRTIFGVPQMGAFPVLSVLDGIGDIFSGSRYEILEDCHFSPNTMAYCEPNEENGFTIKIKESVYSDAYEKNSGASLGFICHELCHVFLFHIGFKPIFERSFGNRELLPYCSVEWQAKALCAEVMIPFEESVGMDKESIVETYHVSRAFADKRIELERR